MNEMAGIFAPNSAVRLELPLPAGVSVSMCAEHRQPGLILARYGFASSDFCTSRSGNVIAWDGRVDNREQLVRSLGMTNSYTDATVALAGFETGGVPWLGELIGDWTAVIWDASTRALVLANDYVAVRPLYYCQTGGRLIWSTALAHLLAMAGSVDIDDDYLREYLTTGGSCFRTPYRGLRAVPPGHAVVFDGRNCKVQAIWEPDGRETLRFRDEQEYSLRLRALVQEAVAVRLRTAGPVYAELSGGLDSSTIVCIAQRLIRERRVEAPRMVTVTYHHEGSRDEPFHSLVQRECEIDARLLEVASFPYLTEAESGRIRPQGWERRHEEIACQLEAENAATFLTGQGGDLVMGNWADDSDQVADLIRSGAWLDSVRAAVAWGYAQRKPMYSILWRAIQLNLRNQDGADEAVRARETSLVSKFRVHGLPMPNGWRQVTPGRRRHYEAMWQLLSSRTLQSPEALRSVCYTHPFTHRPLVEFMLGIPPHIVAAPGEARRLMRRALKGLLPQPVLMRRSKASFDAAFAAGLRPLAAALLESPGRTWLERRGIVDGESLRSRLRRYLSGLECGAGQLRVMITLEYWLRRHESAGGAVAGQKTELVAARAS